MMKTTKNHLLEAVAELRHLPTDKVFKNFIMLIPFTLLVVDAISIFLYEYNWWSKVYYYLNQVFGHNIILCVFMIFYAKVHKYCLYSVISIWGLLTLNIFNIFYLALNLTDYVIYGKIIIAIFIMLSIVFLIRKK